MKNTFFQKFAFTLAEVLITLVIIGVVAAMTIPTLIAKHQDQVTVTKLKKAYTELQHVISAANANGYDTVPITEGTWETMVENFKDKKWIDASECTAIFNFNENVKKCFITSDGILYGYSSAVVQVCTNYPNNKCTHVYNFTDSSEVSFAPMGSTASGWDDNMRCPCSGGGCYHNGCAHWTIRTGKVKREEGELVDNLISPY